MMVQILKEYKSRTEYKVLRKYISIVESEIEDIEQGVLLLPGILLNRLDNKEIKILRNWIESPTNQLIITPAVIESNIKDFFETSLDLIIVREDLDYEGIQCEYRIESKVQEKIFSNENGDFGINYRKDTSSGLLTIITLPLLDYKLSHKHDLFQKYFNLCINRIEPIKQVKKTKNEDVEMREEHLELIMLFAAGYELDRNLDKVFNKYFNKKFKMESIEMLSEEIKNKKLIKDQKLTDLGMKLVKERKLKSFIKVLERGMRSNEW